MTPLNPAQPEVPSWRKGGATMGVPGAFHMSLGQGTRPEPPVWGGWGAIRKQDRVPSLAPLAPLGGSIAQRRGGGLGFHGWKALESHFPSAGCGLSQPHSPLLSLPCFLLWPSLSHRLCVSVPISACLALHGSVCFSLSLVPCVSISCLPDSPPFFPFSLSLYLSVSVPPLL